MIHELEGCWVIGRRSGLLHNDSMMYMEVPLCQV